MIIITRTSVRPSTSVPFYFASEEYKDYFNTNYVFTGKMPLLHVVFSEDELTRVQTFYWASLEVLEANRADPITIRDHLTPLAEHNSLNNIIDTVVQEEEVE